MNIKIFRPFLAAISIFMLVVIPANAEDSLDISTILMRSTFKIQGNGTTGTVFILGEPLPDDPKKLSFVLMTATHVLTSIKSNQATLFLRTRKGDLYERLPYRIDIRKGGEPLWISHPDVDVSAMRIAIPKIADIKLISTDLLATDEFIKKYEVHCSDELFVLGFPYGTEANLAGFPILRSGRIASYPLTPTKIVKTFLLDFAWMIQLGICVMVGRESVRFYLCFLFFHLS